MAATVIGALRRFLPGFWREHPVADRARRRAIWALTHCRTPALGGHVHGCAACGTVRFAYHSCNHRACPQCSRDATARWVQRELRKRLGVPYFMVTFTVPQELRALFFSAAAKQVYDVLFAAASAALSSALSHPRWLGAVDHGFTMILHTWNQCLLFHPHLHVIVPGAGLDRLGRIVCVKSPGFLVPQPVLRSAFRRFFRQQLEQLRQNTDLPPVDPAVWHKDWGVHLQPFGDGANAIKYLGTYVCRTAISDARLLAVDDQRVTFSWKDRARGNARRTETVTGTEFVARYLRHVLPLGLRAIRRYGFCHPSAKAIRERLALHTGGTIVLETTAATTAPRPAPACPCCGQPMIAQIRLPASWHTGRAPPVTQPLAA